MLFPVAHRADLNLQNVTVKQEMFKILWRVMEAVNRIWNCNVFLPGHQSAPSKCSDQRDPGLPGERPGGEGPAETLQPSGEESAAGRVPQGELQIPQGFMCAAVVEKRLLT